MSLSRTPRSPMTLSLALILAALALGSTAWAGVTVTVIVKPPAGTPEGAVLFITGNHESLGPWSPNMRALAKSGDGDWRATLELPAGFQLEYKLTLGSWATVEKRADGADIPNRMATASDGLELAVEVAGWGSAAGPARRQLPPSLTGRIETVKDFPSAVLGNQRNLVIYLPEEYACEPQRRFPVLYMHDGQNLFDAATSAFGVEWGIDETAQALVRAGEVEPLIVVGIYTEANRLDELADTYSEKYGQGGKAPLYARFLVEEVKPFIDRTYRTKPDRANTGVGGSSLGGLVSLYLVETHPEVFGRCAAVSPALLWNDGALLKRWQRDHAKLPLERTKIWLDVGTAETGPNMRARDYVNSVRSLAKVLEQAGLAEGSQYRFVVAEGAEHNEAAWRERVPEVLRFLYPAVGPR